MISQKERGRVRDGKRVVSPSPSCQRCFTSKDRAQVHIVWHGSCNQCLLLDFKPMIQKKSSHWYLEGQVNWAMFEAWLLDIHMKAYGSTADESILGQYFHQVEAS